jgi:putative two-component system response regulator
VLRVSQFAGAIARELGLSELQAERIAEAAMLHDIGKVGISDYILLKPSQLTPAESNVMQQHCQFGRDILQPRFDGEGDDGLDLAPDALSEMTCIMRLAASIAMTHHEWWNGSGYPRGLAGEAIPIEGRITAVADVYDALSSRRPYKPPYPREKCLEIMRRGRGQQFDPRVFDAFIAAEPAILQIQHRLTDESSSPTFGYPSDELTYEPPPVSAVLS